jgi:hypothetical protein
MSCIVLRGCWCHIVVLSAHTPSEEKSDESNDSFYEKSKEVFYCGDTHMSSSLLPSPPFHITALLPLSDHPSVH